MKRFVVSLILVFFAVMTYAQRDVTTFLGIPVDGSKAEMKRKLAAKGFVYNARDDFFEGEFNGVDVHVFIKTNNNKIYRIALCDARTRDEADILIRFNNLVRQFQNNKRYITFKDYTLPKTEDISYGITVENKVYEALFYQIPIKEALDTLTLSLGKQLKEEMLEKYTPEQLENPTEEISNEIKSLSIKMGMDLIYKKPVWFRISEFYGKYYITMFYDNEYNHADGEDL